MELVKLPTRVRGLVRLDAGAGGSITPSCKKKKKEWDCSGFLQEQGGLVVEFDETERIG